MKLNRNIKVKQKGMSLLEVVVAMLVIGIALAGSIAMIQASNRYGISAAYTSTAQQHAQTLINQMRANNVVRDTYLLDKTVKTDGYDVGVINNEMDASGSKYPINYENLYNTVAPKVQTEFTNKRKPKSCVAEPCDNEEKMRNAAKQMAINEMALWLDNLNSSKNSAATNINADNRINGLPQGLGYVVKTKDNNYVVYVMWKTSDARAESNGGTVTDADADKVQEKTYGIAVPFSI